MSEVRNPNKLCIDLTLKAAFTCAECGFTESAKRLWHEAVLLGFEPKPKTLKSFSIALLQGSTKAGG